ncbi:LytR/AlgR family response regulator transcription factor [Psychroserpens luteolus]|uniref:LytR/AlgR family response regulator transcription factor n=1 Tax=Psychroserpens luteolus TaxID=2855840 RepID=UPI001E49F51B|nr:response regulator transcription factor [Psychroserpens luteolus]MCD2260771.1 response regulator transcription factor [Psychroserpens luteolus]
MQLNCLVIDDELLARKRLSKLVNEVAELRLIDECKTGKEAIIAIDTVKPHLIFLDIQMKDMTGFDVLKQIRHEPLVIFVTAYDMYAIKAFDYFAFDYLLKPFKKERFKQSVNRILHYFERKTASKMNDQLEDLLDYIKAQKEQEDTTFFKDKMPVKVGQKVSFLNISDIKYILASGSYVDIFTDKKSYVVRSSLSDITNNTKHKDLIRIHRSTVINVMNIENVIHSSFGEIDVKMKDDRLFRVSKTYRKIFLDNLGI